MASQVSYECTPGNRLSGHRVRFCGPDGRWTGSSPKCEEVRCDAPDLPANGSAIYIGNDRSFKEQSFSVGVTVQYECDYGHVVKGSWASRLCQANGEWSGEAPICQFVDCGTPNSIENGQFVLKMRSQQASPTPTASSSISSPLVIPFESNRRSSDSSSSSQLPQLSSGSPTSLTYFGTVAHYSCDINYKLVGSTQRECLETGSWRQPTPSCEPIQCPKPDFFDEFTQVSLVSRQSTTDQTVGARTMRLIANRQWIREQDQSSLTFSVGDKLHYSCMPGYELYGGPEFRLCTQYGQWSGSSTPRCRLIDCGRPAPIGSEGRFYLLNQTTSFNSLVEYSCVRPMKLIEVKIRQAGNLIETLQQAQAGVTQILTALPIGVKVCANNGQWMPNDQQPKCVSSTSATGHQIEDSPSDNSNNNNNSAAGRGNGQFDGGDNTLDGSRNHNNNNNHDHHSLSTNQINGIVDPAIAGDLNQLSDPNGHHHSSGNTNQTTSSLWAMVVIILCLMIMFGLILLTLICIRTGKKSTKQATNGGVSQQHNLQRGTILGAATSTTSSVNGGPNSMQIHQLAAVNNHLNGVASGAHAKGALASIGLAANGKSLQHQTGTPNHNPSNQHNIYINGNANGPNSKIFPASVMMTPQAAANLQQAQLHLQHQHHVVANGLHHHGLMAYSGVAGSMSQAETIMMNAASANNQLLSGNLATNNNNQSRSIVGEHNLIAMQQNGSMLKSAADHLVSNNVVVANSGSINMMDAYSRTLGIIDNGNATAKTIRHNPNGLVTFVSPAQQHHQQQLQLQHQKHHQQQHNGVTKIPTSVGGSSQTGSSNDSTSSGSHQISNSHSSPQSISTSLSVSPSSNSSSAHHTTATRLSTTNSPSSSTASSTKSNSTADLKAATTTTNVNLNSTSSSSAASSSSSTGGEYQSPLAISGYGGGNVISSSNKPQPPPQISPPSLPAHPPPPHRLQHHQKQMVKIAANQHQAANKQQHINNNNQSSVDIIGNSNEQQQQHHYMEPSI